MHEFIRIEIDGNVVCPGIMPKVLKERTGCSISMPSESGRMHIYVGHRPDREIRRIRDTLRGMVGVTILDEDPTNVQKNGKTPSKATGKK